VENAQPTNVLFDAWLAARHTSRLMDETLRGSGLTGDDFAVYSILGRGALSPGVLAAWLAAPLTTVSSYVKRFEARGHVERVPDPTDGRSYRICLTPSGRAAHRAAAEAFLPALDEVTTGLGRHERSVRTGLARLTAAVDACRPAMAPAEGPPGSVGP